MARRREDVDEKKEGPGPRLPLPRVRREELRAQEDDHPAGAREDHVVLEVPGGAGSGAGGRMLKDGRPSSTADEIRRAVEDAGPYGRKER